MSQLRKLAAVITTNTVAVKISNYQLGHAIDNNRVNLTGAVQPGWDELYRNGILIDWH